MDNPQYFELHVTVAPEKVLEFSAYCKELGAKPLYIQLDKGLHKNQLMFATTTMLPDDVAAKAWALDYEKTVSKHFTVLRTKLESRLTEGPNEYYEAHWKLDFPQGDWECLMDGFDGDTHQLLRSHNLFNTRIHYYSQRIYGSVDIVASSRKFNASGVEINFGGLPLVKTHYERCVWDSNPALDFGWA